MPDVTDDTPLTPPTVEAAVWAESSLASARALRQALARLTIDHRRELTTWQANELAAARRHTDSVAGILALLTQQLRRATTPPAPALPAGVYLHALPRDDDEAAEARADLDYDAWKNAF